MNLVGLVELIHYLTSTSQNILLNIDELAELGTYKTFGCFITFQTWFQLENLIFLELFSRKCQNQHISYMIEKDEKHYFCIRVYFHSFRRWDKKLLLNIWFFVKVYWEPQIHIRNNLRYVVPNFAFRFFLWRHEQRIYRGFHVVVLWRFFRDHRSDQHAASPSTTNFRGKFLRKTIDSNSVQQSIFLRNYWKIRVWKNFKVRKNKAIFSLNQTIQFWIVFQ